MFQIPMMDAVADFADTVGFRMQRPGCQEMRPKLEFILVGVLIRRRCYRRQPMRSIGGEDSGFRQKGSWVSKETDHGRLHDLANPGSRENPMPQNLYRQLIL